MSIPRRARLFGQPTKLQRDAVVGGQDIIYTKLELSNIPGPGYAFTDSTHLFRHAYKKKKAAGSYLSRAERLATPHAKTKLRLKSEHFRRKYLHDGLEELRRLLVKDNKLLQSFRRVDLEENSQNAASTAESSRRTGKSTD